MRFFTVATLCAIIMLVFSDNAEGQGRFGSGRTKCLLYHGSGGESIFPAWPLRKDVVLEVGKAVTLWLSDNCAKPEVHVTKGSSLKVDVGRETLSNPHNVAEGWRLYFWSTSPTDDGKVVNVRIVSGSKVWKVRVFLRANALATAKRASRDALEAKNVADEVADEASQNSGGEKNVEIALSSLISLESPGHEGYGLALGVNAVLGRFASKGMIQLGLSGRLSWHYYEQEVIGIAQNSDVMASEFDALALFLFRIRPVWWFAAEATTGFGVRVFTHDDAVTVQDEDLRIRGVEGRVAYHPLWALNVGVKFWPHRVVSLGVSWGTTVSLTKQVQNPNAEGGMPSKANVWNHFLICTLGINF